MQTIQVRFLGSGDAFGSGGRLQTCICIKATTSTFLVDCGASSLIAMRRYGVVPNDIDMILLTHLHGDHLDELQPKRLIVTHMSEDMLARLEEIPCECAEDGKLIEV